MGTNIYLYHAEPFRNRKFEIGEEYDLDNFFMLSDLTGSAELIEEFRYTFRRYISHWDVPHIEWEKAIDLNRFDFYMSNSEATVFLNKTFAKYLKQGKVELIPPQAFQTVYVKEVPQALKPIEGICIREVGWQRKGLTRSFYRAYQGSDGYLKRNLFLQEQDLRKFYYCTRLRHRHEMPVCIDFPKKWVEGKTFIYIEE